jgi:hypothetical protein
MQLVRLPQQPQPVVHESPLGDACRCGHISGAHEHYRRGSDCALCGCGRYKAARAGLGPLGSLLGVARERSRSA